MLLQNITLEDWLKNPPTDSIRTGGDTFAFYSKYETFKSYLDKEVHSEVTKMAILAEIKASKPFDQIIWLNDHGPEHIKTVIKRASQLLSNHSCLNVREVFILLNAIQVHDVGNFYGRANHTNKVLATINDGLTPILFDTTEVRYVTQIAQVHGGKVKYKDGTQDKNTLKTIKPKVTSDGYDVNQHLLASVLRFADELADDRYRADTKSLNSGTLPKGSEVFHAYASCLDTVKVVHENNSVELHFKIPKKYLIRTFGKVVSDDFIEDVYLLDEIYDRTVKMHYERIYCSKYWGKAIDLNKIWVQIEFYNDATNPEEEVLEDDTFFLHPDITYTLEDINYPEGTQDIFKICPGSLMYPDRSKMTGPNLLKQINKNSE